MRIVSGAGIGIGLGVGLTRDDDDGPPAAVDTGVSQETGTVAGGDAPPVTGTPLPASSPRGGLFPPPAAIAPLPEPALVVPAPAPVATAPDMPAPLVEAPGPADVIPMVAPTPGAMEPIPGPAPEEMFPGPAPGPGPEEMMPLDGPLEGPLGEAPEPAVPPVLPPAPAPVPVPATVPAPVPVPAATFQDVIVPGPDGKYTVCVNGESEEWGLWDIFRPCGVRVYADGRVELAEWYGGFDGFPAVDPADGHETCFNSAVAEMFRVPLCSYSLTTDGVDEYGDEIEAVECEENADGSQCVCAADDKTPSLKSQRGWPGNVGIKVFLETMRERANPTNYDFPQDEEIADNGGRADNVELVRAVFQDMITVSPC